MKIVAVIPTLDRKRQINRLLSHLERQQRKPDEVIISAPDSTHVEPFRSTSFPISYVFGQRGLSAQRNLALSHALPRSDIVTFFDDDFLPEDSYLKIVAGCFEAHSDWAVIMGHVVKDGARHEGFTFEQGLALLRSAQASAPTKLEVTDHIGAYGCNMSMRSRLIGQLRFDERLVLYGWQEDIDFTSQLRRHGRIVQLNTAIGVHLGLKAGRVSGVRFGYSQIANPVYLIKKGTVPAIFALRLIGRNVAANFLRSFWSEPYVDRRGRLKGNLLAAYHLMQGRIEPEYILKI
ncbi:MAG: glycosyltransferase family 2 protein [Pseudorhodoplanes sp.]|jgi:GT2 family glycosyltransferase|nr:glycosyltransferase family 2 protein [Pseudorhodoplanes sp.]